MRTFLLLTLAAVVIISLGGFLLVRFGSAKYNEGFNVCQLEQSQAYSKRLKDGNVIMRQGRHEQEIKSDSDIDAGLRAAGIMREDSDI
jgi:hypothetical protein